MTSLEVTSPVEPQLWGRPGRCRGLPSWPLLAGPSASLRVTITDVSGPCPVPPGRGPLVDRDTAGFASWSGLGPASVSSPTMR